MARTLYGIHVNQHARVFLHELNAFGPDGFRYCGECRLEDTPHSPCQHEYCECPCSSGKNYCST